MVFKASDELNWEPPNPRLTYKRNRENNEICKNMFAMNYTSSTIDKVSDEITAMDAAELKRKKYSDCEFSLNVNMFHYHQDKDKEILKQVQNEIRKNPYSTLYTTKEVEGVDLVHKNNKILVQNYSNNE